MTVSYIGHADAANQVDVFFSGCIKQFGAFGTNNLHGQGRIRGLGYMPEKQLPQVHGAKIRKLSVCLFPLPLPLQKRSLKIPDLSSSKKLYGADPSG
jgi:hypothetical protein